MREAENLKPHSAHLKIQTTHLKPHNACAVGWCHEDEARPRSPHALHELQVAAAPCTCVCVCVCVNAFVVVCAFVRDALGVGSDKILRWCCEGLQVAGMRG